MISFFSKLKCPDCDSEIINREDCLVCQSCQKEYLVLSKANKKTFIFVKDQIDITENKHDPVTSSLKYFFKKIPWLYKLIATIFGLSNLGMSPKNFIKDFSLEKVILNLGSGAYPNEKENVINLDMHPYEAVDIVADMRKLPFKNDSIDGIFSCTVLEHLTNPELAVEEMKRILKKDGEVYLTVPFVYPFHSSPGDYNRWTLEGLRDLMKDFQQIKIGVRHGPTSAFILILSSWLAIILSLGMRWLYEIWFILFLIILAPPAHLIDFVIGRFSTSHNIAAGFYFWGKK